MNIDMSSYITFGVITLLGLLIKSLYTRVSQIPKAEEIEAIRVAVSGVRQFIEQEIKEDNEMTAKQWTKIDDINARLAKVEGMIELINMRGKNG